MKVLIIDKIHRVLQHTLEKQGFECIDMANSPINDVNAALPETDILVLRSRMSIRTQIIDESPNLKIIARAGAGLEHIDVSYAESKGIKVLSSPEGNRQAVAEHALGMLLSLFNKIPKSDFEIRKGNWQRNENQGIELSGKTLGIIGFGNTGSALGKLLSGFGVNILAYDKYKKGHQYAASMEQIWAEADVVSLHLPVTEETRFLVSKSWLNKFEKPVYIVNTSRGSIVNTKHLLKGLDDRSVLGACLDVLEFETNNLQMPEFEKLPEAARRLLRHQNVILTPHIAGLTEQSYERLSSVLAQKIIAIL